MRFRRNRPPVSGTNSPDVYHFRTQLRNIEWALETLDPRADHAEVAKLTNDHAGYRACLKKHGELYPAPRIEW